MGRGRAKAKQTKVARMLKYNSASLDVDSWQRELSGAPLSHREDSYEYDEEDDWRR
jgi:hypothetical protein